MKAPRWRLLFVLGIRTNNKKVLVSLKLNFFGKQKPQVIALSDLVAVFFREKQEYTPLRVGDRIDTTDFRARWKKIPILPITFLQVPRIIILIIAQVVLGLEQKRRYWKKMKCVTRSNGQCVLFRQHYFQMPSRQFLHVCRIVEATTPTKTKELPSRKLVLIWTNGNNLAVIKSFKDDTRRVLWLAAIYQQQICLIMTQLSYALLGRVQYTRTSNWWNGCSQQVLFNSELKLRTTEQLGIPRTLLLRANAIFLDRHARQLWSNKHARLWSRADPPLLEA